MKARTNFGAQTGLNATSLTTVAVTAAMSLGGAHVTQAAPFATEQRSGSRAGKAGFGAAGALDPLPISETIGAIAGATALAPHTITWRTTPEDFAHASIEDAGFFWTKGGPVVPGANRFRYHLRVDANDQDEALARVRQVIDSAEGDSSDLVVIEHDEARIREMTKAIEAARNNPEDSGSA